MKSIWLVKHPIFKHYKETSAEVKSIARRNDLKIICESKSALIDPELLVKNPPALTPIGEAPAKKAPAKKAKSEEKNEEKQEDNSEN